MQNSTFAGEPIQKPALSDSKTVMFHKIKFNNLFWIQKWRFSFLGFLLSLTLSFYNSSAQWVSANGPNGTSITCMVASGNEIYAGSSQDYGSNGPGQLFRSIDYGDSWTSILCSELSSFNSIVFHDSTVFVSTSDSGIYKTDNSGVSWVNVNNGLGTLNNTDLLVCGNMIFSGSYAGVYVTLDEGATWGPVNTGLTSFFVKKLATNGTQIYVVTAGGVFRSDNYGLSWQLMSNGISGLSVTSIAVRDSNVLVGTLGNGVFHSTDYGGSWANIGFSNADVNDVLFYGDTLIVGKNNGVFYSDNYGITWSVSNAGLTNHQVVSLCINDDMVLAGTTSGLYRSFNGPGNWSLIGMPALAISCIGGFGEVIFSGIVDSHAPNYGVFVSKDNGVSWASANSGLTGIDLSLEPPKYIATFGNKVLLSIYKRGLFLSSDTGATWLPANNGLTDSIISVIKMHAGILYAGADSGRIYISADSSQSWSLLTQIPLTSNPYITDFAFLDSSIFVATSGFDGMFVSHNNGSTWSQLNNGLTCLNIWSMTLLDTVIYVGTQPGGIFKTTDYCLNWTPVNTVTPSPWISALLTVNNILFAGTSLSDGILFSSDEGANWSNCNEGLYQDLYYVLINDFYVNVDYIFASTSSNRSRFSIYRRPISDFTGINNTFPLTDEIELYPNPSTDHLNIRFNKIIQNGKVEIIDINSKRVFEGEILNSSQYFLQLPKLTSGLYFISIKTKNNIYTRKWIVENTEH